MSRPLKERRDVGIGTKILRPTNKKNVSSPLLLSMDFFKLKKYHYHFLQIGNSKHSDLC